MKFTLARQIMSPEVAKIVAREVRKQGLNLLRATRKHLQEILAVSKEIEKNSLPSYLVRKKLPHDLGHGIFLHPKARPIPRGHVIAPYSGEVSLLPQNREDDATHAFGPLSDMHLKKEEQKRLDKRNRYHPNRLYAIKLDALKKGNFTRFINHSDEPNIVAHLVRIPKNTLGMEPSPLEVVYFAKKKILPGEQLLVCYEAGEDESYWGVLKIKPLHMTPKTFRLNSALKLVTSI